MAQRALAIVFAPRSCDLVQALSVRFITDKQHSQTLSVDGHLDLVSQISRIRETPPNPAILVQAVNRR
jgi:hypothetical protein